MSTSEASRDSRSDSQDSEPVAAWGMDDRSPGLLARMRIRKKLIFLHTIFSLSLAIVLVIGLRPTVREIVLRAEMDIARQALAIEPAGLSEALVVSEGLDEENRSLGRPESLLQWGDGLAFGLSGANLERIYADAPEGVLIGHDRLGTVVIAAREGRLLRATVRSRDARRAVGRLYGVLVIALLGVYFLVALALEVLVLPRHVYGPIQRILRADRAVQEGDVAGELITESSIPADELGEIMRSRNASITKIRRHEQELARAFESLEHVAADLARKNQLLERAKENLQDADRLRSLAIMSAGLAHEMNTPLTVLKGLAERLALAPSEGLPEDQAALLKRVVTRLEGLSESLLDFARVRPPTTRTIEVGEMVKEATTLVELDREARNIRIQGIVEEGLTLECDGDRMVQVLVNLVRNAVDAISEQPESPIDGEIVIRALERVREDEAWVSILVEDNGPGIDPSVLPTLFDPFVSTRLDALGTGLGLAVAEGIVREHGGVLLARNRPGGRGAIFEVLVARHAQPDTGEDGCEDRA